MASISPQSVPQQFISPFSVENIISKKETGLKGEETSLNHSGSSSASAASGYGKFFGIFHDHGYLGRSLVWYFGPATGTLLAWTNSWYHGQTFSDWSADS